MHIKLEGTITSALAFLLLISNIDRHKGDEYWNFLACMYSIHNKWERNHSIENYSRQRILIAKKVIHPLAL